MRSVSPGHKRTSANSVASATLAQAAQHDPLTNLPNRTLFRELVQRAITQTSRAGALGYAVLFVDLDGFKLINDTHGHVAGDRFLKAIAARLHSHVRPGDVLARLGGDEFGVLAERRRRRRCVRHRRGCGRRWPSHSW